MKHLLVATILLLCASLCCMAQDTIYTTDGGSSTCKIEKQQKNFLRATFKNDPADNMRKIPNKFIDKIVFADGTVVKYVDGTPQLRDASIQGNLTSRFDDLYLEGVYYIDTRLAAHLMGEDFAKEYKKGKILYTTGEITAFLGVIGTFPIILGSVNNDPLDKTVRNSAIIGGSLIAVGSFLCYRGHHLAKNCGDKYNAKIKLGPTENGIGLTLNF